MSMSGTWTLQSFSVCFRLGQLGDREEGGREGVHARMIRGQHGQRRKER